MNIKGHGTINFKGWSNSYIPQILHEIYLQKIYFPYIENKKDLILFDVGANIGLWSMYASQFAKKIYAFEPSGESFELMNKNIKDNNFTNINTYKKAVSEKDGTTTFYYNENTTMNSLKRSVEDGSSKSEDVETVRLDTFVKKEKIERINFMKLDIEGTENLVIASESFRNIVPILDSFIYEWHQWSGVNPNVINGNLRDYGYTIKQISESPWIYSAIKI